MPLKIVPVLDRLLPPINNYLLTYLFSSFTVDALLELFTNFLLPNDGKLKLFQDHPFKKLSKFSSGNKDTRDKILILWHFEAKLKECYKTFLTNLGEVSKDTIEKTRMKVMTVILQLLTSCPEQEQELLSR